MRLFSDGRSLVQHTFRGHLVSIVVFLVIGLIASCSPDPYRSINAVLLDRSTSTVELYKPNSIIFARGMYWITDQESDAIYRYDTSFTHSYTISRLGQGPGEFIRPRSVATIGDSLVAVLDVGNARITILGNDGSFRRQWPVMIHNSRISEIRSTVEGHIICSLYEKPNLVFSVYDINGNFIKRFCDYPITELPIYLEHNGVHYEVLDNGNIYVAFRHFPLARLYDSSYELVWEQVIAPDPVKEKLTKYGNMLEGGVAALKSRLVPRIYTASTHMGNQIILSGTVRRKSGIFTHLYFFDQSGELASDVLIDMPDELSQKFLSSITLHRATNEVVGVLQNDSGVVRIGIQEIMEPTIQIDRR